MLIAPFPQPDDKRIDFLDSMRGTGALIVLLSHVFACYLFHEIPALQSFAFRCVFFDGQFAVHLFFVLSGTSLSVIYFETKSLILLKNLIFRRYFRLALPIAAMSFFVMIMVNSGTMTNLTTDNKFTNDWVRFFYHMEHISIKEWLSFSFYDSLFLHGTDTEWLAKSINPVLWTIPIEFLGSVFVFLFILLFADNSKRFVIYPVLIIFFICTKSFMLHFILGVTVSDLYVWLKKNNFIFNHYIEVLICAVFVVLLFLFYFFSPVDRFILYACYSFILLSLCVMSSYIQAFLTKRFFLFWGKICFSLYLVHLPIICSLTPLLASSLQFLPSYISIVSIGGITVFVSIAIALLFHRLEFKIMYYYKKFIRV